MGLVLGDLAAIIRVDDEPMEEGLVRARRRMAAFGEKLQAGAAVIGAALGAAISAGLISTLEIDAGNDKLAAQLGLTKQEAARIGKDAGDLFAANYGESMEQVNEAVGAVISSIDGMRDASSETLQDITSDAINLASVFGVDVARAAQVAGQAVKSGLVTDAKQAMDLLTASMQQLPANVREDLLDAIDEYGPFMQQLGIKGEEAFSMLVAASEKGAFGLDKTGDALKEFTILATDMSTSTGDAYKSIGLNQQKMTNQLLAGGPQAEKAFQQIVAGISSIKDPAARSQAALAFFGTPLEDLSVAEIPAFLSSLKGMQGGLGDVAGAANRMGDTLGGNASAKLEGFKRKAQQALVEKLAQAVPYIEATFGWLEQHSDWVVPLATGLGAFAAAVYTITLAMKAWAAIQVVLNLALWTSPITWIVLGIVALVAVIVLIAVKTTWFQDLWKVVWGGIKDAAGATWSWISGTLWPGIKAVFSGIGDAGLWLWHNAIEPAWNGIRASTEFMLRIVTSSANLIAWALKVLIAEPALWLWHNAIEPSFRGIGAVALWLWNNVISPTYNAISASTRAVGAVAMWLWHNSVEPAFRGVASVVSWLWNNVIFPNFNAVVGATHRVGDAVQSVFSRVGGWVSAGFSNAAGIVKGAMNSVIRQVNAAISGINSLVGKANSIPGVNFPSLPHVPYLAKGGIVTRGGRAVVGERGAEVVDLPTGAAVYPNGSAPAGGGITVEHLEVRAFSDQFRLGQVMDELAMHGVH